LPFFETLELLQTGHFLAIFSQKKEEELKLISILPPKNEAGIDS
jgi:hypothetical protein